MGNQQEDREREIHQRRPRTIIKQKRNPREMIGGGGIKSGHRKKSKNTRQRTLTSSIQKEKAKAKEIATIAGSQVIERSSALIRRKRKEMEKEDRHRRGKVKEKQRWGTQ